MTKNNSAEEPEPRVPTSDVQRVLQRVVQADQDGEGPSVSVIAAKANTSTRTVYRVLAGSTKTLSLDLADRLCLAADSHLNECNLVWPNGDITSYYHLNLPITED